MTLLEHGTNFILTIVGSHWRVLITPLTSMQKTDCSGIRNDERGPIETNTLTCPRKI